MESKRTRRLDSAGDERRQYCPATPRRKRIVSQDRRTEGRAGRIYSRYSLKCYCDGGRPPLQKAAMPDSFPKEQIETLWAPWRVEYFEKEPHNSDFLAAAARASDDAEHLVIARRKTAFLMM